MKKNRNNVFVGFTIPLLLIFNLPVIGQPNAEDIETKKLTATILHLDSLFWKTYNECEPKKAGQFLSNDVKFYHDKGGITEGKETLIASVQKNICGNLSQKIRREAVDGTIKVYPLRNAGIIYGAIISGEHYFYVKSGEQSEKREGLAKFTHLWLLNNNKWEMSHILSYDHGPAPQVNKK